MSNNTLDGNAEYSLQQANFKHQDDLDGIRREQEMLDADAEMTQVRRMWDHNRTEYQDKLNKFIEQEKAAKAAKDRTGGKSRVFRKKSNKTTTKKVSRRNRRSRNIRRNSRAHKRK